ncbi:MAG: hypothetical protein ABJN36_03220 [Cyclobacteriaceae bacterium]
MKTSYIILSVLMILVAIVPAMAQGAPPATPIDGGLSALLAAGGIYGIKKIRDMRK